MRVETIRIARVESRHLNRFEDIFVETDPQRMTAEEFLAMEDDGSGVRYEYFDGEVCEKGAASVPHLRLAANLARLALNAAPDHCEIFVSDLLLHVQAMNCYFFPDLVGVCEPCDDQDFRSISPCFVVEVLSPSTAKNDRHMKRFGYLTLPSINEYVVVDQSRMHVEVWHRERGPWASDVLNKPEHILELSCINLRVPLESIYQRVRLPEAALA